MADPPNGVKGYVPWSDVPGDPKHPLFGHLPVSDVYPIADGRVPGMGHLRSEAEDYLRQVDPKGRAYIPNVAPVKVEDTAESQQRIMARGGRARYAQGGDPVQTALETAQNVKPLGGGYTRPVDYSAPKPDAHGLYSHAAVTAGKMPMAKGSPEQIKGYLLKNGVKPDEMKWSGFDEAFGGRGHVTREQVAHHFASKTPRLDETSLGEGGPGRNSPPAKFEKYSLPGGKKYRETLTTLPSARPVYINTPDDAVAFLAKHYKKTPKEIRDQFGYANARDYIKLAKEHDGLSGTDYQSSHWDDTPNVVLHRRLSDRIDPATRKKMLHLEEMQSDWAQEGREKGFKLPEHELVQMRGRMNAIDQQRKNMRLMQGTSFSPDTITAFDALDKEHASLIDRYNKHNDALPHAPYVDSTAKWMDLGLKRTLHDAAKGGYHKIVITPGEEQAERYDLSKHIKGLTYSPRHKHLEGVDHNGRAVFQEFDVEPDDIAKHVGKDVAQKLLAKEPGADRMHRLEGEDIIVGGEGMHAFYDRMLPQALQKLAQKHDPEARVQLHGHSLENGPALHSLELTPRMRASILKGMPHYESGGAVEERAPRAAGGRGYKDPETKHIADWPWRPLNEVQGDLDLHEIPSHVEKFGSFMDDTAHRAELHGLTPRDLIKAYTITRSSIQRGAVDADKVRAAGLHLPTDLTGKIRPEGAFGTWLHTPQGQRYLDAAEGGRPDEDAIAHAVQVMAPFGKHEKDIPDALRWAARNLPGREGRISELVARARRGRSSPEEWRDATSDVRGIGSSKSGFLASMLGRGDQPTLDARQLVLHTGQPTKAASPHIARKGGAGGVEATDRLAARQSAMRLRHPLDLSPYYQHLAHHAVWDKAGGDTTTHSDVIDALQHAATGGAIKANTSFHNHPLVHAMRAAGLPGLKRGGSAPDDDKIRDTVKRLASPFSGDPAQVAEAMRIVRGLKPDMGAVNADAGYYNINQPLPPSQVTSKIGSLKGVTPATKKAMSWEDLHRQGKGGSFINLGGDRSAAGRMTHINGRKLAWPIDLHAGPDYMRELNPGAVWANNSTHSTALRNTIIAAAKANPKGPVYGVYAPMGPRAVDSSHNMFDAVMAQIPGRGINAKDAAEFDRQIKAGEHIKGNTKEVVKARANTQRQLEKWPGILNAKAASDFARTLPGVRRSAIIKHMDKREWLEKDFPAVGMTRVAISDPDVHTAPGNMIGHRIVELDPDKYTREPTFKHSTYPVPTAGRYVGDLPLVQRQYAMPDPTRALLGNPTSKGEIVHPFSPDKQGRSTVRKMFEEQKQIQPLDYNQLESTMQGLANQKAYGFKRGGSPAAAKSGTPARSTLVDHALRIAAGATR